MSEYRTCAAEFEIRELSDGRIPVTISTTNPVMRHGMDEVLSHDPADVDLRRQPLPLIVSHDQGKLPVGVVEDLRLVGGKLRGWARFGSSPVAQQLLADIKARIITAVSAGYVITKVIRQTADSFVCAWEPIEVSIVSVPADHAAGFYRSFERRNSVENEVGTTERTDREELTSRSQRRAANRSESAERERVAEITAMAEKYGKHGIKQEEVYSAIRNGDSAEAFRHLVLERISTRPAETSHWHPDAQDSSHREWSRMTQGYSLVRALQYTLDPAAAIRAGANRELEMSDELAKRNGQKLGSGGFLVPDEVLFGRFGQRTFQVGSTATGGGALHSPEFHGDLFAEGLRARTIVGALGARVLSGLTGNLVIPRQTAVTSLGWTTELGTASETDPDMDQLTLSPKRITAYVDFSRKLMIQSSLDVESLIRNDLLTGAMVELDRVCLSGSGASNEPTGITNTIGIGSVVGGTNGAAINWGHLVSLESAVANVNADRGSLGYAINPKTRAALKVTQKATNLDMIWSDIPLDDQGMGRVNGYRAGVSTLLRSNLTKGTSNGVCSELFFGDWSEAIIGRFGSSEVTVDPYTLATTGAIRVTLNQYVDFGVRRPVAFAKMTDALTS